MAESPSLKSYMQNRRSSPVLQLGEPGPSRDEIAEILSIAARVPDHGKLAPWRFVVFRGEERERLGRSLAAIAQEQRPGIGEEILKVERERLTRAPVVVMLVSRAGPHAKIPEWEQQLSAGAAGMNLLIAANALGYAACWLTEWMAYDTAAASVLGIEPSERIAGFIHIGSNDQKPFERDRPELEEIVTWVGGEE
ncbi:nitroreductase family protein [Pararhizobium mangrovi]|uniref:Putative NAD(P)H nitroreductase n=1 Tax=Pararhizobium mangrovi TaxID=2590452 RepID=A0A506UCV9_9HYPH|nr:nitroreductase [Pararhizobium mangrovi]TPW31246.1 nitroreductase [Pararhizobium mangrovi]